MLTRRRATVAAVVTAVLMWGAGTAAARTAGELAIGLQDDPDSLDPVLSWSFVGRHVLQSLCDKLLDVDGRGMIVPMLASSWSFAEGGKSLTLKLRQGVTFHDGTPLDAAAVVFNFDRLRSFKGSRRLNELDGVESTTAVDAGTVRIKLKNPSMPFLSILADRAGMMVSPKAATSAGDQFHKAPVCAGPYRLIENVPQDRIVLGRFAQHWRSGDYHFDRVVFRGIPDSNVRLVNLRADQLQLVERLSPTDLGDVARDKRLATHQASGNGYYGITFNIANGEAKAHDARRQRLLRQAFDLAIDRDAINKVVFDGLFEAGNQPFAPSSPYFDTARPVRARDVAAARTKLAEAGLAGATIELLVPTDPQRLQAAEMMQSMLAEAGIKLTIQRVELMTMLARAREGKFQAMFVGWSGRSDPDLNITPLLTCKAGGNDGRYCNPALDAALETGRAESDPEKRKDIYRRATAVLAEDLPIVYLYHQRWLYGARSDLKGFAGYPDGIIRLNGVRFGN